MIPRAGWFVIKQGERRCRGLSSGTRHDSPVDRRPHFLAGPICQTGHLQRQISIARVVMGCHPNRLKTVEVLSILILVLIIILLLLLLGIDGWLL